MKHRAVFLFLITLTILLSCKKTDQLYTLYRVYFKNIYRTASGLDLKTEANPDKLNTINGKPYITAYYAEVVGTFTHVYDSIVQHGHVWSQTNPDPRINPNDTTTYTRLGPWPIDSSGVFISQISGLYPNTPVYIRSYIITSEGDTGYNPFVLVDTTLEIVDAWYFDSNIGTMGFSGGVAIKYGSGDNVKVVVGTGRAGQLLLNAMWSFNPEYGSWEQFANYPEAVTQATGFALNYKNELYGNRVWKLYIGTGELNLDGTAKSDYWYEYDFGLGVWKPTASYTNYPYRVSRAISFTIGEYGYVGFGSTENNTSLTTFFRFDPVAADSAGGYPWVPLPTLESQYARADAIAFTIQGVGFVGLGINTNTNQVFNDLWKFYPDELSGGIWIQCESMPAPARYGAVALTIDNYGYVGLGTNGSEGFKDFYRYDPFLNTWYQCTDYKVGPDFDPEIDYQHVRDAIGFSINSVGYVGTGYEIYHTSAPYTKQLWRYIPW